MSFADVNLNLTEKEILALARSSKKMEVIAFGVCDDIIDMAKAVFLSQSKGSMKASETSPPKYLASFTSGSNEDGWFVRNTDPGAAMVEFGALAGGTTPVLKYAPLRRAVDILTSDEAP